MAGGPILLILRGAVALAGIGLIGSIIVSSGLARHSLAAGQAQQAVARDPGSPSALVAASQRALVAGQYAPARERAIEALAIAPLTAAAASAVGIAELAGNGDAERGSQFMFLAASMGWRDTPAQRWVLENAMATDDAEGAAARADALARRREDLGQAFEALRAIAAMEGGQQAVADRLIVNPDWRGEFMGDVTRLTPADYPVFEGLIDRLMQSDSAALPSEIAPYIRFLVQQEEYGRAQRLWLRWTRQPAGGPLVRDGSFDQVVVVAPGGDVNSFSWTARAVPGAEAIPENRTDIAERVVRVQSDGGATRHTLIYQTVVLPAGARQFRINVQAERANDLNAFRWVVRCLGGANQRLVLNLRPDETSRSGWQHYEAQFAIPGQGCPAQQLELITEPMSGGGPFVARFDQAIIR